MRRKMIGAINVDRRLLYPILEFQNDDPLVITQSSVVQDANAPSY